MNTILIATDFSSAATNAAIYATEMAVAIHANLFILHVANVPVAFNDIPTVVTEEEIINGAEEAMLKLKEQLLTIANRTISVETEVVSGTFFESLKETCKKVKPYIVIMGTQGKSEMELMFFGSHAAHAMQHLMWPLIAVPSGIKFSWIKKIGLACDFDRVVETAPVSEIKTLINDFRAELHVLNIGKKEKYNPEVVFQSGLMQEMFMSLKPEYHFLASDDIDQGIMDFAEMQNIDLLIVLPKRHSFIDKIMHKSHTKQFALHSHVPILALHQ